MLPSKLVITKNTSEEHKHEHEHEHPQSAQLRRGSYGAIHPVGD